jgi:hypothetical protein
MKPYVTCRLPYAILHIKNHSPPEGKDPWYSIKLPNIAELNSYLKIMHRGIGQYANDIAFKYDYIARLTAMMPDRPETFYVEYPDAP